MSNLTARELLTEMLDRMTVNELRFDHFGAQEAFKRRIAEVLLRECAAAERGEVQPVAEDGPTFTLKDPELNELLNLVDWVAKVEFAGMDAGMRMMDLIERVEARLAAPPAAPEGIDAQLAGFLSAELPQLHQTHPGDVLAAIDKFRVLAAAPTPKGERG